MERWTGVTRGKNPGSVSGEKLKRTIEVLACFARGTFQLCRPKPFVMAVSKEERIRTQVALPSISVLDKMRCSTSAVCFSKAFL